MSTMLIPEEHIDVIVEYAANPFRERISYYFMGTWNTIGIQVKADELGQMLLTANIKSFNEAYNEDVEIPQYKFRNTSRAFKLVEIFKAIECLRYNTDIQGVEAVAVLDAIRERIISTVFRQAMGYDDADGWTIATNLSRETREGKAHRLYSEMITKTREGEKMFPRRLHTVTTTEMFVRQMYSALIASA